MLGINVKWGVLLLVDVKKFTALEAGAILFWFEIGGILGTGTICEKVK